MHGIGRWLRRTFLAGVALLVPVSLTGYLLWFVFTRLDALLAGLVRSLVGRPVPGGGLAATLILVLGAGLLATNLLGRRLIGAGERALERIPGIRSLYSGLKQVMESVILPEQRHFRRAVLVSYPRPGLYSLGFITQDDVPSRLKPPEPLASVYIPTAPNPTSGFLVLVPRADCIELDLPVADAFQIIISAGLLMPERVASPGGGRPGVASPEPPAPERGGDGSASRA